jgi:hypothetical protein
VAHEAPTHCGRCEQHDPVEGEETNDDLKWSPQVFKSKDNQSNEITTELETTFSQLRDLFLFVL